MAALSDQSLLLKPREVSEAVLTVHDNGEVAFLFSDFTGRPVDLFAMRDVLLKLARHLSSREAVPTEIPPGSPPPGWTGAPVPSGLLGPADGPLVLVTMPAEGTLSAKEA